MLSVSCRLCISRGIALLLGQSDQGGQDLRKVRGDRGSDFGGIRHALDDEQSVSARLALALRGTGGFLAVWMIVALEKYLANDRPGRQ